MSPRTTKNRRRGRKKEILNGRGIPHWESQVERVLREYLLREKSLTGS